MPTDANKQTCSRQCSAKLAKQHRELSAKQLIKTCKWCGKEFIPKSVRDVYCDGPHYSTCTMCGKQFEINVRYTTIPKTCSKECRYSSAILNRDIEQAERNYKDAMIAKYGVDNPMKLDDTINKIRETNHQRYGVDWYTQTDEYKERVKETSLEKYGVDHFLSAESTIEKRKKTCESRYGSDNIFSSPFGMERVRKSMKEKYGVINPSQYLEFKRKATKSAKNSSLERRIENLFNNYNIEYAMHHFIHNDNCSHEFDFYLPKYKILIDADGLYWHSYLDDPNGKQVLDYYDDIRMSLVPEDHMFFLIIENTEDKQVKQIVDILDKIDNGIFDYDSFLFDWCRSIDFPYPQYSLARMQRDIRNLQRYTNDKYIPQCRIGESAIKHYHRSIYDCRKRNQLSPKELWYDDTKLKKVITNRLIYANNVDPSKILSGFNVSRIGQVVSIFNPILAKYLTENYLSTYDCVFDPFSGFSGRLLGVTATGKQYVGQDINPITVSESWQLIQALNIPKCNVECKDSLQTRGKYPCLLTCPPYSDKEIYFEGLEIKSCDEWIDAIVNNYDCERYVFVVDYSNKYKENIVEELQSTSHFNTTSEYVVVLD